MYYFVRAGLRHVSRQGSVFLHKQVGGERTSGLFFCREMGIIVHTVEGENDESKKTIIFASER